MLQFRRGGCQAAFEGWSGWDAVEHALSQTAHVFTDGLFDRSSATSAWSVAVCDEWLEDNYGTLPDDEQLLTSAHVGGAALFGASITRTRGV